MTIQTTNQINQLFTDYEEMQTRHIRSYAEDLNPDIEKQNFERDKIFENLKNDLTNVLHMINNKNTDNNRTEVAHACQERIQSLLDQDRLLMDRLIHYREGLIRHLKKMGHGKRALKGYMTHCDMSESARSMDKSG